MENEEREIRMEIALEILDTVYTDCCKNSKRGEKSSEVVSEFCDSLIQLHKIKEKLCDIKDELYGQE